ncbi:MAG TPA: hypothetical protein DEB15_04140 [Pusillimonas sp.]|jgi:hypothetical protein|nr:hypothetical protein [Pusillimonas sp.]MBC43161.1 hypothetical protein [Pusillimonas sp.]HBT32068.1 hypothetical protein [Pusillimonas sp.]HCN72128.1 hypothetical protein [Pusillimonas sp.]HCP76886.1 hypothetical protein [Pusillimonas sp.]|tara:strand:+ start:82086 stop:82277 length:192 start_codon:yes stop_codon:yes gene_type:complete
MKSAYYSYRRINSHQTAPRFATQQSAAPVLPSIMNCYLPVPTESGLRFTLRRLLKKLPRVASH